MKDPLPIEKILWREPGRGIAASGRLPETSEFFNDHFPDFPVLPGVLGLEILRQTAVRYFQRTGEATPPDFLLREIRAVKFSDFFRPGEPWESRLELLWEGADCRWRGRLLREGRTAVTAEFIFRNTHVPQNLAA